MRRKKLQQESRESLGKKHQGFGIESQTHAHQKRKSDQAGPSLISDGFTNSKQGKQRSVNNGRDIIDSALSEELGKIKFRTTQFKFPITTPLSMPAEVSAFHTVQAFISFGGYGRLSFEYLPRKRQI